MDFISNKALYIAVGLFISIVIASSVIFTMSKMKEVYSKVDKADVNIQSGIDEYSMYNNTIVLGIDVYNTAKKYNINSSFRKNTNIVVRIVSTEINNAIWLEANKDTFDLETRYNATYSINENNGLVTVIFTEI
jgi:hypothetical protein